MSNSEDYFAAGFKRVDSKYVSDKPPRIHWGQLYKDMTDKQKIHYLEKLASTMNHAAYLVQQDRNELGRLCELKEEKLIKMAEALRQNNAMLQQEMTMINVQRQGYHDEVHRLNTRIRELERGNHDQPPN